MIHLGVGRLRQPLLGDVLYRPAHCGGYSQFIFSLHLLHAWLQIESVTATPRHHTEIFCYPQVVKQHYIHEQCGDSVILFTMPSCVYLEYLHCVYLEYLHSVY